MNQPIFDKDEKEILGYLAKDSISWKAQTIFGYIIARTETKQEATTLIHKQGLNYLKGVWQYYDKDDYDWYPCVIQSASETLVSVARTNAMGYQEPETYKVVLLKNPDENMLIKNS